VPFGRFSREQFRAAPEIDNADEIEFWHRARIGLPRAVTDNAKRNGNHGRARKEVQGDDG
jgi:hypothetical protein